MYLVVHSERFDWLVTMVLTEKRVTLERVEFITSSAAFIYPRWVNKSKSLRNLTFCKVCKNNFLDGGRILLCYSLIGN